jgi:hypothetical protein
MWRIVYDVNGNILFKIWSDYDEISPEMNGLNGNGWGEIQNYNKGVLSSIHRIDINTAYKKIEQELKKGNSFKDEGGNDLTKVPYHKNALKNIDKRAAKAKKDIERINNYHSKEGYKTMDRIYHDETDYSKKRMAEELQKSQNQSVNNNAYITPNPTPEIQRPVTNNQTVPSITNTNSTPEIAKTNGIAKADVNNANTQSNTDMNPPIFIYNSQGIRTHKILKQPNGSFKVLPTNDKGLPLVTIDNPRVLTYANEEELNKTLEIKKRQDGSYAKEAPNEVKKETIGQSDWGPEYSRNIVRITNDDGSKDYKIETIDKKTNGVFHSEIVTEDVVRENIQKNGDIKVNPEFQKQGEILHNIAYTPSAPNTNTTVTPPITNTNPPAPVTPPVTNTPAPVPNNSGPNYSDEEKWGNGNPPVNIYDQNNNVIGQYVVEGDNYVYHSDIDPQWGVPSQGSIGKKLTNAQLQELIKANAGKGGITDVEKRKNDKFYEGDAKIHDPLEGPITTTTTPTPTTTATTTTQAATTTTTGTANNEPVYNILDLDSKPAVTYQKNNNGTYTVTYSDGPKFNNVVEGNLESIISHHREKGFKTTDDARNKIYDEKVRKVVEETLNPINGKTTDPNPANTTGTTTTGVNGVTGNPPTPPAPAPNPNVKFKDQQTFYLIDKDQNIGMKYREKADGTYRVYPNGDQYNDYIDVSRADLENIILEKEKEGFSPTIPERNRLFKMDRKTPEGIREIQRQLGVPPTGVIDDTTTAAIRKHQVENKLKDDGIAGPVTIGSIEKNNAAKAAAEKAALDKAATNPQSTPTIVDPNVDKVDPNKKVDLAPITGDNKATTDATGNATTPKLEGDTNNDGIVDERDVLVVEETTPEIATNNAPFSTSPFTRRVTHGIWEPFGNDEDSAMEYRTRPIKRIYTNPQRQDTSTATVVNEFLGKTFGNREDRQERRDNRRYENDKRNNQGDTRDDRNDSDNNEKVLEGKEKRVRRSGPLFQNPMVDVARDVIVGKAEMPEFDNVRDARQFDRAVKQAQTFMRREDDAINREHNRNAAKYDKTQNRLRDIRLKTEERLGRKYATPNPPSQGNTSLPTSPVIGDPTAPSKQYPPLIENSVNDYNKSLTPSYNFQGQGVIDNKELLPEIQTKQFGGQIMQDGSQIVQSRVDNPFQLKKQRLNNANWNFDGLDELPEYRFNEEQSKKNLYEGVVGRRKDGRNTDVGYTPQSKTNQFTDFSKYSQDKFGLPKASKLDLVPDPINFIEGPDASKKTATTQGEGTGTPYWNSRRLNVFGNQMQHEANMYPVMYNVGKSLFDKAEVQNPIYNKQDVAFLQGMKRNQIGLNMNPINDNRAAMNQAIRGNARGSGQILNAYAAAQNAASKNMNDEMYRVKNANQAQENNYLQALNQVGSNRREIDTLVDEKNRQHRLAFEKFQRDALESGEKAQINKGQMLNQELSDKITMDNYLNQIGKNFKYKLQRDGTYLLEFEDFSGNKRTMDPRQTKATMEVLQKSEQDKLNANQAAANAQAGSDAKAQAIAAENTEKLKLQAIEEQRKLEAQQEARKQAELQRLADEAAKKKASGNNKTGGYIYKRKSF